MCVCVCWLSKGSLFGFFCEQACIHSIHELCGWRSCVFVFAVLCANCKYITLQFKFKWKWKWWIPNCHRLNKTDQSNCSFTCLVVKWLASEKNPIFLYLFFLFPRVLFHDLHKCANVRSVSGSCWNPIEAWSTYITVTKIDLIFHRC